MLAVGNAPAWGLMWLLVVAFIPCVVLSSALALLLASVNVYLRDTQHLIEVLVGAAWFWACPIVYSYQNTVAPKLAEHGLTWLYFLNPMTPVVMTFQRVLYAKTGIVHSDHRPWSPDKAQLLPVVGRAHLRMDGRGRARGGPDPLLRGDERLRAAGRQLRRGALSAVASIGRRRPGGVQAVPPLPREVHLVEGEGDPRRADALRRPLGGQGRVLRRARRGRRSASSVGTDRGSPPC